MSNYHRVPDAAILESHPEVLPYFYDINSELAARAFYNTSHSPERRGAGLRADYARDLINDKQAVIDAVITAQARGAEIADSHEIIISVWFDDYRRGLKSKYLEYLHSHSRVASAFICGPANFPVARNRKRIDAADNKQAAIDEFRARSKKNVLKALLPFGDGSVIRTDDPNAAVKIESKVETLVAKRNHMKQMNVIVRRYYKKGETKIMPEKHEQCRQELKEYSGHALATIDLMLKPNYMGYVVAFESYELTNLGAQIRRLKVRTDEVKNTQSIIINDEFENGITVDISTDQKICIHFGFIPNEETRGTLKSHAFKWSRGRVAWVRKLTGNAQYDYKHVIKPMLQAIEG